MSFRDIRIVVSSSSPHITVYERSKSSSHDDRYPGTLILNVIASDDGKSITSITGKYSYGLSEYEYANIMFDELDMKSIERCFSGHGHLLHRISDEVLDFTPHNMLSTSRQHNVQSTSQHNETSHSVEYAGIQQTPIIRFSVGLAIYLASVYIFADKKPFTLQFEVPIHSNTEEEEVSEGSSISIADWHNISQAMEWKVIKYTHTVSRLALDVEVDPMRQAWLAELSSFTATLHTLVPSPEDRYNQAMHDAILMYLSHKPVHVPRRYPEQGTSHYSLESRILQLEERLKQYEQRLSHLSSNISTDQGQSIIPSNNEYGTKQVNPLVSGIASAIPSVLGGMAGGQGLLGGLTSNPLGGITGSNPLVSGITQAIPSVLGGGNPLGSLTGSNPLTGGITGSNPLGGITQAIPSVLQGLQSRSIDTTSNPKVEEAIQKLTQDVNGIKMVLSSMVGSSHRL